MIDLNRKQQNFHNSNSFKQYALCKEASFLDKQFYKPKFCHFDDDISVGSSLVSPLPLTTSSCLPYRLVFLTVMMNGWTMYIGRDNVDKTVSWCGISAVRLGWGVAFFLSFHFLTELFRWKGRLSSFTHTSLSYLLFHLLKSTSILQSLQVCQLW